MENWTDFEKYVVDKLDRFEEKLDKLGNRMTATEVKMYIGAFVVSAITAGIINKLLT